MYVISRLLLDFKFHRNINEISSCIVSKNIKREREREREMVGIMISFLLTTLQN